jgi:hypothetical protein
VELVDDFQIFNPLGLVLLGAGGKRPKVSKKIQVVNSVTNDQGFVRRKDAEFFVKEKRAEWVGQEQIRLIMSHPKNQAAAKRATAWTLEPTPVGRDRISQTLQRYGTRVLDRHSRPCGLEATDNPRLTFRPTCIRRKPWVRVPRDAKVYGYPDYPDRPVMWVRPDPLSDLTPIYEALVFDADGRSEKTWIEFIGKINFGRQWKLGIKAKVEPEIPDSLLHKQEPERPQAIREITHGALHSEFSVRWKPPLSVATIAKLQNPGASPFEKYRREER